MNTSTVVKMILISSSLKFIINIKKYFKIKTYKNYLCRLKSDGYANPSFTIFQLAVRLYNNLEKKFS